MILLIILVVVVAPMAALDHLLWVTLGWPVGLTFGAVIACCIVSAVLDWAEDTIQR